MERWMPIYEYECLKCGEIFEVFQKLSDPPPKSHKCGSRKVRRIMSRTSFVLKGTGWYITDYGRKDQGGGREKNGGGEKSNSSSSEKGSEKSSEKSSGTSASSEKSGSSNDKADKKTTASSSNRS